MERQDQEASKSAAPCEMGCLDPSLPLLRVALTLHHQTPRLGHATLADRLPNTHVEEDVAVFLEEVPISPLGYRHHLQVLGEEGA